LSGEGDVANPAFDAVNAKYRMHQAYRFSDHAFITKRAHEDDPPSRDLCVDAECGC
jgi:hypothetical protein